MSQHSDSEAESAPQTRNDRPEPSAARSAAPSTAHRIITANPARNSHSTSQSPNTAGFSYFSPISDTGTLSPGIDDRVFPIRSVVSVDPTPTPTAGRDRQEGYFPGMARARDARRYSNTSCTSTRTSQSRTSSRAPQEHLQPPSDASAKRGHNGGGVDGRIPQQIFNDIASSRSGGSDTGALQASDQPSSPTLSLSATSGGDSLGEPPLVTARFRHVVSKEGHAIITGRDGDVLQRCEDEPIHIPGAIQSFGALIALEEESDGKLIVRVVSENSKKLLGYSPKRLFGLESFCDILSEEQTDNLLDHIDFIRDEDADVGINGPEVFTITIRGPDRKARKLWCAMHVNKANPDLVICEFELEDDMQNPLVPPNDLAPDKPEDTLQSKPTAEEFAESTQNASRPLRVLRNARKRKGEAAAMEVFNIMSQVQEQLAAAKNLDSFLRVLVGVVKELTGFHRVMVYQFDSSWNGRVVTELVDPRTTKDLYKGLNFPASDIPKQARELYKINKVRLLYDRDQETSRLVCRTVQDLETPLDLTYSYLRAMSPIHIKYLANMAVRSSMSISINAFGELWGLISCHSYGPQGMRVSFPIRKMCRLVGDSASRNIERLSYASRLQARKLINTVPTRHNPSGYIIASSDDLLKLFDADFGLLSIRDETKILGEMESSQEALAMLEYLRMRKITSVSTTQDINYDFPDLRYQPGFKDIAGMLIVPLTASGTDFIVFFRKGQLKEVKWAGNPYEKFVKEGTEGYLEPRKSFKTWSETVVGKCREWTDEEVETAAVLCLVYGKFIEVWRQKEAALQSSQLTKLLLANSAHEVRTPLNAIINYLEIALEGQLDNETRENLAKSHSASKSLIYVINDFLDLTKTEEGGELIKPEVFDLKTTFTEATNPFAGDAKRKGISFDVVEHPGVPQELMGDQRRVRQAISNITANAIKNTSQGGVKVDMYVANWEDNRINIEISVLDTGSGMSSKKLDALFRELEQVQSEHAEMMEETLVPNAKTMKESEEGKNTLGLGLAVVARVVRNMNGQLRLRSEEGKGSRFIIQLPFELPNGKNKEHLNEAPSTPQEEGPAGTEVTLVGKGHDQSHKDHDLVRRNSADSALSKRSRKSLTSVSSANSGKSDVDRLIEAIQEPQMVERSPSKAERSRSHEQSSRPSITQRSSQMGSTTASSTKAQADGSQQLDVHKPGEAKVPYSGFPIKSVKVAEDATEKDEGVKSGIIGQVDESRPAIESSFNADHMRVLVAEDDPVNSRIIKKRLEKLGHDIVLTVNGEDCATVHDDNPASFDVVLMDMQMPIVDGLTSTKMIRSFEKSHPSNVLSPRAAVNGRIPIIAVSASLEENKRQNYIDTGFDAWILKPISFPRLQELMVGIFDLNAREELLYKDGEWEKGGWFERAHQDLYDAQTKPSGNAPTEAASEELKEAAQSDSPDMEAAEDGRQTQEQKRLREVQKQQSRTSKLRMSRSTPDLGSMSRRTSDDWSDSSQTSKEPNEER